MSRYVLEFTPTAAKDIAQPYPLLFETKLKNLSKGGDFRFRVGNYRVVFDIRGVTKLTVLYIEHRREVYRRRQLCKP